MILPWLFPSLLPYFVLQVALIMAELTNLATVLLLKTQHMKLITWETSQDKILMQVDTQDFMARITTNNKDSGELTLVINSTKIRVDHPIGHHSKGLISMRGWQSWKRLSLNSCRFLCQITRAQSRPSRILRSRWDSWPSNWWTSLQAVLELI